MDDGATLSEIAVGSIDGEGRQPWLRLFAEHAPFIFINGASEGSAPGDSRKEFARSMTLLRLQRDLEARSTDTRMSSAALDTISLNSPGGDKFIEVIDAAAKPAPYTRLLGAGGQTCRTYNPANIRASSMHCAIGILPQSASNARRGATFSR